MLIITPEDKNYLGSVRTLLGVDREDFITITNDDIDDLTVLDAAEMYIMSILPPYVPVDHPKVRLATIYYMAALLCPSMASRVDITVKNIDSGWTRKAVDYLALADGLMGKAIALIEDLTEGEGLGDSSLFRVAPSKRAVRSRYDYLC